MPPYNPPIAHYTEVDASDLSITQFLKAIGKEGIHFKRLTERTGTEYIWWNQERNIIEVWGSFGSLSRGASKKVRKYLDKIKTLDQLKEECTDE